MACHIYIFGIHAAKVLTWEEPAMSSTLIQPVMSIPSDFKVKKIVGTWVNLFVLTETDTGEEKVAETIVYNGMEDYVSCQMMQADQVACTSFLALLHKAPGEAHRLVDGESTPSLCEGSQWLSGVRLQAMGATDSKFFVIYGERLRVNFLALVDGSNLRAAITTLMKVVLSQAVDDGKYGQLKTGDSKDPATVVPVSLLPQPLCLPISLRSLACGKDHMLLLADSGVLLSHGIGSRGQLGHGNLEDVMEPKVVEMLEGVKMAAIAAGGWHSAAVTEDGVLYMWGTNESGQLGLPKLPAEDGTSSTEEGVNMSDLPLPVVILDDLPVKAVSCGSRHTAVLADGRVFTAGWNKYGQLGVKNIPWRDNFCELVLNVESDQLVCSVFCYHWCTVVLTEDKSD